MFNTSCFSDRPYQRLQYKSNSMCTVNTVITQMLDFVKCWEILDSLSHYQVLNNYSAPCNTIIHSETVTVFLYGVILKLQHLRNSEISIIIHCHISIVVIYTLDASIHPAASPNQSHYKQPFPCLIMRHLQCDSKHLNCIG